MRFEAQVSMEFLIYVAVAISALSVSLYATAPMRSSYYSKISEQAIYGFSNYVIQMQQYDYSRFSAFVPKAICSCTSNYNSIRCGNFSVNTGSRVLLSSSLCFASGSIENISETYIGNGTYKVSDSQ
jgi:uncharacterized protein (UPF0333 family)